MRIDAIAHVGHRQSAIGSKPQICRALIRSQGAQPSTTTSALNFTSASVVCTRHPTRSGPCRRLPKHRQTQRRELRSQPSDSTSPGSFARPAARLFLMNASRADERNGQGSEAAFEPPGPCVGEQETPEMREDVDARRRQAHLKNDAWRSEVRLRHVGQRRTKFR